MYNPDGGLTPEEVQKLRDAFTTMSSNDDDLKILDDVLSTPGITIIDTESHLGDYGDAIGDVPGIEAYFTQKTEKVSTSSSGDSSLGLILPVIGVAVAAGAVFYYVRTKKSETFEEAPTEEASSTEAKEE